MLVWFWPFHHDVAFTYRKILHAMCNNQHFFQVSLKRFLYNYSVSAEKLGYLGLKVLI